MYGFILVSHSQKIAQGVKELIEQMVNDTEQLKVMVCGGHRRR